MVLSRRSLLFGAAATLGACSARGAVPLADAAGPSSAWKGAAGSGFTDGLPTDVARVVAKPALRWMIADRQRFASDLAVGVDADANGGVDRVEFFVEGSTSTVSEWTRFADKDANGAPRTRGGYWITLSHAAFMRQAGAAGANAIQIYARAWAKNPLFQPRTIGPLTLYPEATAHDFMGSIRLDGAGGAYPSLKAALSAARQASAKSPKFTIEQTGFYEFEDGVGAHYTSGAGYCVITHAPGVVATIGRANFPGANSAAWDIDPRYDGLEFRGSGIVIDHRNFVVLRFSGSGQNHWLNGCKVTSSEGTAFSLYWNKGYKPQGLLMPDEKSQGVIEDTYLEYGNAQLMNLALCRGNRMRQSIERLWNGTMMAADNYADGSDTSYFRQAIDAFSITYMGQASSATIEKTGNNGVASAALVLREDGAPVANFVLGRLPTDPYYSLSSLVAAINARPGWSATLIDTAETRRSSYLGAKVGGDFTGATVNGFGQTEVKNTSKTCVTFMDIHSGGWNIYTPGKDFANAIIRNNTVLNIDALSSQKNFSIILFDVANSAQDIIFEGNLWDGGIQIGVKVWCPLKHIVFRNNTQTSTGFRFSLLGQPVSAWSIDEHCVIEQCIFENASTDGPSLPNFPVIRDCCVSGQLNGPNHFRNFVVPTASRFVDAAKKDFRPSGALLDAANKRPALSLVDGLGKARASVDAVGAWAASSVAPVF